ncbi:hypothetical protein GF337_01490 [candidate division KSB1 bacterium]|nr:hypothetical protein [candidate division KSB1 bacterium]
MPGQPEPGSNPWLAMDSGPITMNEPGLPSSIVVGENVAFEVSTEFFIEGFITPVIIWLMSFAPGDDFQVEYFAESLGPGDEKSLGVKQVLASDGVLVPGPPPRYNFDSAATTLTVPAGTLSPGTYKLTCVVRPVADAAAWWTAFHEGPVIQVHEA